MSIKKEASKEIEYLDEHEYILFRPNIFIGSVTETEEKIPIIENSTIVEKNILFCTGLYKIVNEVIDNAFDEAKRHSRKCKISLRVDTTTNKIIVVDTGSGFLNPNKINDKTKLTNVETAVSKLRAGSNFKNVKDNIEESIVGTNGMGVCLTNMFSSYFSIVTANKSHIYKQVWNNFISEKYKFVKNTNPEKTGTIVTFIPRDDIFKGLKYNVEYIITQSIFKKFIITHDKSLQHIDFELYVDDKKINLDVPFYKKENFYFNSKHCTIYIVPNSNNQPRVSFINGTQTTSYGQRQVHELIFHDKINDLYKNENAHNFYSTYIFLNLPPTYVEFADQNKTRFITKRGIIEEFLDKEIKNCVKNFKNDENFNIIKKLIEEFDSKKELKKLQKVKSKKELLFSTKFFPSNKKRVRLFLAEGKSAGNPLAQYRNSDTDAVYALKGKLANALTLKELNADEEIKDLISILNLDNNKKTCTYDEIIIAADADVDGYHITALIINFFYRWFRYIIEDGRLKILHKPLFSTQNKNKREYFYEIKELKNKNNIRYLKGLGSYDDKDWEHIFGDFRVIEVFTDKETDKLLNMAFTDNAEGRKRWLQGIK